MEKQQQYIETLKVGWLVGKFGFNSILSMQIVAISCRIKFISKENSTYKRNYSFRMNIMEEIFAIRICIKNFEE